METIEELRAKLRLAEEKQQRAEAKQRQAEEKQQRAEEEKQRAEEETRNTTLRELIKAHHELVFTKFTVEKDEKTTSKGSLTSPAGRRCPRRLEVWEEFLEEQTVILGNVFSAFPAHVRAFMSRHYMEKRGNTIRLKPVRDEIAVKERMEDLLVEPVKAILERLQQDGIDVGYNIGAGITFENRVNALGEAAEPPRTPNGKRPQPDQICAYMDDEDSTRRTMACFFEFKPPHKLTPQHLRVGLRSMDIYNDVVNRPTIPSDKDQRAKFQYHADLLAASAVTQTFDCMIQAGLTYGCLTTGEVYVFLKVDWTDMTLYYHLAEPGPEVAAHEDNFLCCTAVSQVLAFTIMALDSRVHYGQDDRKRAIESLNKWEVDWEAILRSIPRSERVAPPDSPAYRPTTYKDVDRSPYGLRQTRDREGRACKAGPSCSNPPPEADDEGGGGTGVPGTPTPAQPRARRALARRPRGKSSGKGSSRSSSTNRQYCSQCCLLGLVTRGDLDEECPNVELHRGGSNDRRHPVDHNTWLGLLREQVQQTLDDGVVPLGKRGARGVVFQVTLLRYGYTFVAKAARARFMSELKREGDVYRRLRSRQGACVPVFLGVVDLRELERTYYHASYESDMTIDRLVHFMFLSHGGRNLADLDDLDVSVRAKFKQEVINSVRRLHRDGVVHTDVRDANVLWDGKRVMLIDFEQAELVDRPRPVLAPVVPNKRRWRTDGTGSEVPSGKQPKTKVDLKMEEDIMAAKSIFDQRS